MNTILTLPPEHQSAALNRLSAKSVMPDASAVFAEWINATRAMLGWDERLLSSLRVEMDGGTYGFDAAMRKVASEIHGCRIKMNNNQLDRK